MTRKDYELIANEIRWVSQKAKREHEYEAIDMLVDRLCIVLALDNGRFNEQRFREACAP